VRALLLEEVLSETAAPHLRTQVSLAIGLLDAVAVEVEEAPAALIAERARMIALARHAAPLVQRTAPDDPLAADLTDLAVASATPADYRLSAMTAESERLHGILDHLGAFCDDRLADGADRDTLRRLLGAELRAGVGQQMRWAVGGAQG
jgi:hypothetical protein